MYFPFLRAKQFDLIALRESLEFLVVANKVVPILEPVRDNILPIERTVLAYCEKGNDIILVTNPTVGDYAEDAVHDVIKNGKLENAGCVFAYMLSDAKSVPEFVEFGIAYKDKQKALIHNGFLEDPEQVIAAMNDMNGGIKYNIFVGEISRKYRRQFKDFNNVNVVDDFAKEAKNSLYKDRHLFSELPWTYLENSLVGYGDFSIIGQDYSESGGPAYAVAIHLTYAKDEQIICRHFVSDTNNSPVNPAGKFFEALTKLHVAVSQGSEIPHTKAVKEFIELFEKKHFPGLGYVKKLCLMHHIELNYSLMTLN